MKRLLSLLAAFLLLPCLTLTVGAAVPPPVWDEAGMLTESEENSLYDAVQALKRDYDIDVMIVISTSLNGETAQDRADDLYAFLGGGDDGVLFLLAMEEREWYISTCGDLIYALTDYGIQEIGEAAVPYFSQGSYYNGFSYFLYSLPDYLDAYLAGSPIDGSADYSGDYYHGTQEEIVYVKDPPNFFLSVIIGLITGGITIFIMYRMMDDKNKQSGAAAYLKDGSFHLNTRRDLFLYSNLSKTRKQQNTSSGGGSSVHRSSSGRRHGGGGGKF